jgi:hypothetical protein
MYPASTRFFTHVATGQIREEPPVHGYARFKHRLTGKARVASVFIPPVPGKNRLGIAALPGGSRMVFATPTNCGNCTSMPSSRGARPAQPAHRLPTIAG